MLVRAREERNPAVSRTVIRSDGDRREGGLSRVDCRARAGRRAMTTLSDAQLGQIADAILVARDRTTTNLPTPTTTGPDPFKAALDPIATQADFKDAGIGIIDFTDDFLHPDVWVNNPAKPFRIGSASKIGMMLAAVQLRLDVRSVLGLNIITAPARLQQRLRQSQALAKGEAAADADAADRGHPAAHLQDLRLRKPLPWTSPGPIPTDVETADGNPVAATTGRDRTALARESRAVVGDVERPTFSERLWLAGCMSDNVAATACVSQIGVPFIKAVMRSYGLFNPANGMSLFPSYGYDTIPRTSKAPAPAPPRALTNVEPIPVTDYWWTPERCVHRPEVVGSRLGRRAHRLHAGADGRYDSPTRAPRSPAASSPARPCAGTWPMGGPTPSRASSSRTA